ncbi:unnamed protein product [marine sediment metagenome]|uniref:Nucleoside 2-deoxyribosyltransferase n=1 Tax=marine sediment metagenome TaxID=412755 RepID=X0XYL6_9ZZZZ
MKTIYLAGPFFNEEQTATIVRAEALWDRAVERAGTDHLWGRMELYSPRREFQVGPDSTENERGCCFQANLSYIRAASLVFARIDDFDAGTVWEMGYAYAVGATTVTWTTVEGRGLNLMLAQSARGHLVGWDAVEAFIDTAPDFDWEMVEQWGLNPKHEVI